MNCKLTNASAQQRNRQTFRESLRLINQVRGENLLTTHRLSALYLTQGFDFLGYQIRAGARLRPSAEGLRRLRERARRRAPRVPSIFFARGRRRRQGGDLAAAAHHRGRPRRRVRWMPALDAHSHSRGDARADGEDDEPTRSPSREARRETIFLTGEKQLIALKALKERNANVREIAKGLGVGEAVLYRFQRRMKTEGKMPLEQQKA